MRRHPDLRNNPAIIMERSVGRSLVVDATPFTSGVLPGMNQEEALSIRPEALVLEADESSLSQSFLPGPHFSAGDQRPGRRDRSWVQPTSSWTAWSGCTAARPVWLMPY